MIDFEKAADLRRSGGVKQRADRPSQRAAFEGGPVGVTRALPAVMTLRASSDGGPLTFDGHASVYERGYEMWDWAGPYTEIVSANAATESLSRADLSVPLVLDHDSMRRIALTDNGSLVLSEDDIGLRTLAANLNPDDMDVRYIKPKMDDGLITEMSFRFRITAGQWSPDYTEYRINTFDIHRGDVSIVGYGANPFTTSTMRVEDVPAVKRAVRGSELIHESRTQHLIFNS